MSMFMRRGKSATFIVPTIANTDSPTVAEVTAGTNISGAVAQINGFETSQARINQAVQKYRTEQQIAGPETFPDANLVLLEDDGTGSDEDSLERQEAQTVVIEDASFHVVLLRNATEPVANAVADIYTVSVGAVNPSWSLDAEPARYTANFFVSAYKKGVKLTA